MALVRRYYIHSSVLNKEDKDLERINGSFPEYERQ